MEKAEVGDDPGDEEPGQAGERPSPRGGRRTPGDGGYRPEDGERAGPPATADIAPKTASTSTTKTRASQSAATGVWARPQITRIATTPSRNGLQYARVCVSGCITAPPRDARSGSVSLVAHHGPGGLGMDRVSSPPACIRRLGLSSRYTSDFHPCAPVHRPLWQHNGARSRRPLPPRGAAGHRGLVCARLDAPAVSHMLIGRA
jgi:hypothetical protein